MAIRSPVKLFILHHPLQKTEKVTKLINTSSPRKPKPLLTHSRSVTKSKSFSINIKRSAWLNLFKTLLFSCVIISIFTVTTFAAVSDDIGGAIVDAAIQKPLVFSWMQSEDHVPGSTTISAVYPESFGFPEISDFTLVDNPYPDILDQNNKVWKAELNFSNYDDSVLKLSAFGISTEFYLPIDTSFGDATYLTFGVYGMLECTQFISDLSSEDLAVSIGDKYFQATSYHKFDGNKFVALFSINGANIQQSMEQQKVKFNISFGEWYPYDPFYGEKPNFYLQFGDITQTISMTANQAYLDNIFGLLQGDSSNNQAGSDFNNSMQDSASNANGLVDQMNDLNKPSMGDIDNLGIDTEINSILNYQATSWLTNAISIISSFPLISSMAFIGLSVSLISFAFYGKKG